MFFKIGLHCKKKKLNAIREWKNHQATHLAADSDYTVIFQNILVTQMIYFRISIFEEIQVSNIAQDSKHQISNDSDEMSALQNCQKYP